MRKLFLGSVLAVLLLVGMVNSAPPTTSDIPDQTWDETFPWTLDLSNYFDDPDVDPLTYDWDRVNVDESDIDVTIDQTTGIATFTMPEDEDWVGVNTITFTAEDNETIPNSITSNEVALKKEVPNYCKVDDGTRIEIGDIEFDDDEYKIGETVKVDIEDVEATVEDLEDVEVEVCLYNVDDEKEVECWETEEGKMDIDEDDKEDYSVEFKIPNHEDIGKKDTYRLVVYVNADDEDGDNQCVQDSEEIEIERETHDVIVNEVSLSPSVVEAGETVQVSVEVENIGTKDEDDCYVLLKDGILGINLESSKFDLEEYTDSDNDHTVRFMVVIPEDAKAQDYMLEPIVYFDDADQTNGGEFATLTVEKEEPKPKPSLDVTSGMTEIDATKGKNVNLHLVISNSGEEDLDGTVELNVIGDWAENILPQAVSLHPGENNVYLPLGLKESVTEGMHTATVTVKPVGESEFDVEQTSLSFDVSGELGEGLGEITGAATGLKGSSVFWIIGDIVLVIIALFFIKAIFFGGRKPQE